MVWILRRAGRRDSYDLGYYGVGLFVADNYNSCFSGILVVMAAREAHFAPAWTIHDDEWRFARGLTPEMAEESKTEGRH